jgi:hypothetical protein
MSPQRRTLKIPQLGEGVIAGRGNSTGGIVEALMSGGILPELLKQIFQQDDSDTPLTDVRLSGMRPKL